MKELWELYLCFARIGAVTFGGGYAMLPILERELVIKRHWVTIDELMDYFAVGQCTPGIIAVNVSTFIGDKRKGAAGALAATLGFITIPIILITIIALCLRSFADLQVVKNAFAGIRVCVCVLILNAVTRLWKKSIFDVKTGLIFAVIFALTVFSGSLPITVSPAILVVAAAVIGIAFGPAGDSSTGNKTEGASK